MTRAFDLCVLGGGAGGLMVLWHHVHGVGAKENGPPRSILWIDETGHFGRGPAYATRWPQHLLNVPAGRMSLHPDRPDDFVEWLAGAEARAAATTAGCAAAWEAGDYVPRLLFGAYLRHYRRILEARAAALNVALHRETARIDAITANPAGYALHSARETWQAGSLVLALGNRAHAPWSTPMLGSLPHPGWPHPGWLGRIWDWAAAEPAPLPSSSADLSLPALVLGSGLSAVDAVLQLRASGWRGRIEMLSRHAALPAPHAAARLPAAPPPHWPEPGARLSTYLLAFRRACAGHDWRAVMDALRPQTRQLWQRLSLPDQRRFVARLGHAWNVHRHRMAPSVAALMAAERVEGSLTLHAFPVAALHGTQAGIEAVSRGGARRLGALAVDCTGPGYDWRHDPGPLGELLQAGLLQLTPNHLGLAMDARGWAGGTPGHPVFALGALGVGARWESVAIPELRQQARDVAEALREIS